MGFFRSARRLPRGIGAIAALVLCVCIPMAQLAQAAPMGLIECCCGEHEADHDCGCLDCPAAQHAKQAMEKHEEEDAPAFARWLPCGLPTTGLLMPELFRWQLSAMPALERPDIEKAPPPRWPVQQVVSRTESPPRPPG
jgi:hypothetical protein